MAIIHSSWSKIISEIWNLSNTEVAVYHMDRFHVTDAQKEPWGPNFGTLPVWPTH